MQASSYEMINEALVSVLIIFLVLFIGYTYLFCWFYESYWIFPFNIWSECL